MGQERSTHQRLLGDVALLLFPRVPQALQEQLQCNTAVLTALTNHSFK